MIDYDNDNVEHYATIRTNSPEDAEKMANVVAEAMRMVCGVALCAKIDDGDDNRVEIKFAKEYE